MKSILFVCTGNICRSPMAEVLLRHMFEKENITGVEVFSRGVYAEVGLPMTDLALAEAFGQNADGSKHGAAQLTRADVDRADLVLVMEYSHEEWIQRKFPDVASKTYLLMAYAQIEELDQEIADPYGGSPAEYRKCRMEIQNCLLDLISKLKGPRREKYS